MTNFDEPSLNAQKVITKRYSQKDKNGNPIENWPMIVDRVVRHVASAESDPVERGTFVNNLKDLVLRRMFIPNTPCLVNAGATDRAFAGCFVLSVEDSIKGIMGAATNAAVIHQSGGGTGFTFERLRPAGSLVKTTHGVASGPISFMEIFDKVTDVVKQGGVRRGANMGILRCDHPSILEFIHAKQNQDKLLNFNISVSVTDEFMDAVKNGRWIQTKFEGRPWTEPVYDPESKTPRDVPEYAPYDKGQIYAPDVWNRIIESAHKWGEPGVIFIDEVNRKNLLMNSMGAISSCNPCGEQFLHDYNSCNLGSIDVAKFYCPDWNGANSRTGEDTSAGNFHWENFQQAVYWSVRFLDNVIDVCNWPLAEIDDVVKRTRPVGLGIMGFADLLLKLKIRYGSQESLEFLSQLMSMFRLDAWEASLRIGKEKGAFPEYGKNKDAYDRFLWDLGFDDLILDQLGEFKETHAAHFFPRNYEVTNVAPTGTISLVAECSSGIEPNFAWEYTRRDTVGERTYYHPLALAAVGVDSHSPYFSVEQQLNGQTLPDYFVTAHDLSAEEHVRVQAVAQKYVDNGISKTVNGHKSDTVEDVKRVYELAYELGCKAVSYYRDGCRNNQVLTTSNQVLVNPSLELLEQPYDFAKCAECGATLTQDDKCQTCPECGLGKCSL
jgi:ribonucleoside-diphosphate reductase alpha chain